MYRHCKYALYFLLVLLPNFFISFNSIYGEVFRREEYPLITEEMWEQVSPYLIPKDHEALGTLNELFSNVSILKSKEDFENAGFKVIKYRAFRRIVIAKHPKLRSYVIKAYLDNQPTVEWPLWVLRAKGSRFVQSTLDRLELNDSFKVPRKWIYPIKRSAKVSHSAPHPKSFVLLVDDMHLVSNELLKNKLRTKMTKYFMNALFLVLKETGYSDCHLENLPLSKDGKIAFIDLEHVNEHPVHFNKLDAYFSKKMLKYWHELVQTYDPDKK